MKNIILRYGLIYGGLTSLIALLFQHGLVGIFFNIAFGIPLMIAIIIVTCRKYKASKDGFAPFGDLMKLFMGVLVLASLISLVITLIHRQLLSDLAKENIMDNVVEAQLALYEFIIPNDEMSEIRENVELRTTTLFDIDSKLKGFRLGIIASLIIALISAAIMKKNRPENDKVLDSHL